MGAGAIGIVGTLASTGLSIYGQQQQAKAATQAAEYNNNLAEAEASNQEAQTAEGIKRQRINDRAALSEMRLRISGSGSQSTTGTPLNIMGETAGRLELGIADAARNSAIQASSMRAQGQMGLWEAQQTAFSSKIQSIGTGIAGLSQAFSQFQEGQQQGMWQTRSSA